MLHVKELVHISCRAYGLEHPPNLRSSCVVCDPLFLQQLESKVAGKGSALTSEDPPWLSERLVLACSFLSDEAHNLQCGGPWRPVQKALWEGSICRFLRDVAESSPSYSHHKCRIDCCSPSVCSTPPWTWPCPSCVSWTSTQWSKPYWTSRKMLWWDHCGYPKPAYHNLDNSSSWTLPLIYKSGKSQVRHSCPPPKRQQIHCSLGSHELVPTRNATSTTSGVWSAW